MIIPNKFNGYSRDGVRLYNDPATATITIASMGEGAAIASSLGAAGLLGTVGTSMVGANALAQSMALGTNLYTGGGLGSLTGQGANAALDVSQVSAMNAPTGVASNFNAPQYLSNLQTPTVSPFTPDQMAMNTNMLQSPILKPTLTPATNITPTVNAIPESTYNLSSRFPGLSERQFTPAFQNGQISENLANAAQQQRITAPGLPSVESITAAPAPIPSPAPVVEATPITAPVESSMLQPSNVTPADYKLATSQAPAVTEGGIAQAKPGMTGGAWEDTKTLFSNPSWENIKGFASEHPYITGAAGLTALRAMQQEAPEQKIQKAQIRPYTNTRAVSPTANYYVPYSGASTAERNYFTGGLEAQPIYNAAEGGLASFAVGGPVETMSAMNAVGENLGYPQSQYQTDIYSNPNVQRPEAMNMIAPSGDIAVDAYTGEQKFAEGGETTGGYKYSYDPKSQQFTQLSEPTPVYTAQPNLGLFGGGGMGSIYQQQQAQTPKPFVPVTTGGIATPAVQPAAQPMPQMAQAPAMVPEYQSPEQQLGLSGFYDYMNQQLSGMRGYQGFAEGGLSHLGGYSDGGRLLRGPGDGVSDSIPASIGDRQPARLADGEFVVPARIVSEIGNGSTEAGARKLYAMMERVQGAREKSVGKGKVAVNSKADKYLPA